MKVLEAGGGTAVAVAGRIFADGGAEVAKIVPSSDERDKAWSAALDHGKLLLAPEDARCDEWLAAARVVLLGNRDQSFPDLEILQPRLAQTVARICAFDESVPVDDLILQAAAGMCAGIGEPGRPALKLPLDQSAQQGGLALAIAASATLFSEESARIDVSTFDVWLSFYAGPGVADARFGRSKTRRGGHRVFGLPWPRTILRCKDGYFAVCCSTRDQWRKFLALVGRPELESAELFKDRIKTNDQHAHEAEALFGDWFTARTKDELTNAFLSARIPGSPIYTIPEVATSEHLAQRKAFYSVNCDRKAITAVNLPYALHEGTVQSTPRIASGPAHSPLKGIRVLDFGWVWAGAVPGHILADLGAEVIKVETANHLDYMRQGRPIVGTARDPEQNPMFAPVNRGKASLRIDMTKPEGSALLRELAAVSDIVIENSAPGVLERYGLGWQALSAASPGLIMCSMSAAGATGPLRDIRTYAPMIAGLCGLDSMVGYPNERVLGSQSSYADPNGSLYATFAILSALKRRNQGGAGCWIDLSQWEAGVRVMGQALASYSDDGKVPAPSGLQREDRFVHNCFPTAGPDEWIAISVRDEDDWHALRTALGEPEWMRGVRFKESRDATVEKQLAGETIRFAASDLAERLSKRPMAAAVLRHEQLGNDPKILARDLFEDVENPILGPIPIYRLPWRINGNRCEIRRRAPLFGEHTDYVMRELLHLSEERIAELTRNEVFV